MCTEPSLTQVWDATKKDPKKTWELNKYLSKLETEKCRQWYVYKPHVKDTSRKGSLRGFEMIQKCIGTLESLRNVGQKLCSWKVLVVLKLVPRMWLTQIPGWTVGVKCKSTVQQESDLYQVLLLYVIFCLKYSFCNYITLPHTSFLFWAVNLQVLIIGPSSADDAVSKHAPSLEVASATSVYTHLLFIQKVCTHPPQTRRIVTVSVPHWQKRGTYYMWMCIADV